MTCVPLSELSQSCRLPWASTFASTLDFSIRISAKTVCEGPPLRKNLTASPGTPALRGLGWATKPAVLNGWSLPSVKSAAVRGFQYTLHAVHCSGLDSFELLSALWSSPADGFFSRAGFGPAGTGSQRVQSRTPTWRAPPGGPRRPPGRRRFCPPHGGGCRGSINESRGVPHK